MKRIALSLSLLTSIIAGQPVAGQESADGLDALGYRTPQVVQTGANLAPTTIGQEGEPCLCAPAASGAECFWARADYSFGWLRGSHLPPLLTTSPTGTPQNQAGVLGNPGTTILEGDASVNGGLRNGVQITLGRWLDDCQDWGIEGNFFWIGSLNHQFAATSDGSRIIARPFTDALSGNGNSQLVSFPGAVSGTATVDAASNPLYGANVLLRKNLCRTCSWDISALAGYRFMYCDEDLRIGENLTSLAPATLGTGIVVNDHFATQNQFQGGELGLETNVKFGRLSLGLLTTLSIGNLRRSVNIDGSTVVTAPGFSPLTYPGGLLALSSNSGQYSSDKVILAPEIGINAGWQLTPRLRATAGYNVLWWPGMANAGDQIDLTVNPNLLPPVQPGGPARPAFALHESTLWVQRLNIGLEFRY